MAWRKFLGNSNADTPKPANQVFTQTGFPRDSYVRRPEYEDELLFKLNSSSSEIIEVAGPSKTGKSSLVQHCLEVAGISSLIVYGSRITNTDDFWMVLAEELELSGYTINKNLQSNIGIDAIAQISGEIGTSEDININRKMIRKEIVKRKLCVVIEDFHQINPNIRSSIVKEIKALSEQLERIEKYINKIIIVLVLTRDMHNTNIWKEIQGRMASIHLNLWNTTELEKIVRQQIERAGVAPLGVHYIAEECFGLPYIMQLACLTYWYKYENNVVIPGNVVNIHRILIPEVFSYLANSLWYQGVSKIYETLCFSSKIDYDKLIENKDHLVGNINQMIFYALIDQERPPQGDEMIIKDRIIYTINSIIIRFRRKFTEEVNNMIKNSDIENAIKNINDKAIESYNEILLKTNEFSDPILEYNSITKELIIYDPAFLVTLRYAEGHKKRFTENQSDL